MEPITNVLDFFCRDPPDRPRKQFIAVKLQYDCYVSFWSPLDLLFILFVGGCYWFLPVENLSAVFIAILLTLIFGPCILNGFFGFVSSRLQDTHLPKMEMPGACLGPLVRPLWITLTGRCNDDPLQPEVARMVFIPISLTAVKGTSEWGKL